MKTLKKMSALLVALVMTMFTVVPAFAVEYSTNCEITNNITGHKFEAYQIFQSNLDTSKKPTQVTDVVWGSGVNPTTLVPALKASTDFGTPNPFAKVETATDVANVISNLSGDNQINFAQFMSSHLTNVSTPIAAPAEDGTSTKVSVVSGYYLIVDKTDSLEAGDALNPAVLHVNGPVTIQSKKDEVTVEKKVKKVDEADAAYADVAETTIGNTLDFKLSSKVINDKAFKEYDAYFFEFEDWISKGLEPVVDENGRVIIKSIILTDENGNSVDLTNAEAFTSMVPVDETREGKDGKLFRFSCTDLKQVTTDGGTTLVDFAGKTITLTYQATLTKDAVVGMEGNPNKVVVNYSRDPNGNGTGTSEEDEVHAFTFELDGTKVNLANTDEKLSGAEFVLYREVGQNKDKEYAELINDPVASGTTQTDNKRKIVKWTKLDKEPKEGDADYSNYVIVSKENTGKFEIEGLGTGTFYLKETKAPAGYVKKETPFVIIISANKNEAGTAIENLKIKLDQGTEQDGTDGVVSGDFANSMSVELPETGGMGTTMLYVAGGILLVGSAVLLVTKKRMGHEG